MPTYVKTILCLANSYKMSGRCLAGVERQPDGALNWIRPVSAREHGEVSEQERMYPNGRDPQVGDILDVPFLRPARHGFQTENHLLDPKRHWAFRAKATPQQIAGCIDRSGRPLWRNDGSSSRGRNDRVREVLASPTEGSLRLIEVGDLEARVALESSSYASTRKVRGAFTYAGRQYLLGVTDPLLRRRLLAEPDASHTIGRAFLCVSLGEPMGGFAYKLIAAVIAPAN